MPEIPQNENGTEAISYSAAAKIKKNFKLKKFFDLFLTGGDITYSSLYRAMDLQPVTKKIASLIHSITDNLRTRHVLDHVQTMDALNNSIRLLALVYRNREAPEVREYVIRDIKFFIERYDRPLEGLE